MIGVFMSSKVIYFKDVTRRVFSIETRGRDILYDVLYSVNLLKRML